MTPLEAPKAFISYSWDSNEHRDWVRDFASRLRRDGIDVMLDQWGLAPGDPLPSFMEVGLRENDFILIICTPRYKKKSDERLGGVGYEGHIMIAELFTTRNHRKFVPLLRHNEWESAAPSWLSSTYYIDLFKLEIFEESYRELLDTLHRRRQQAPPIGMYPRNETDIAHEDIAINGGGQGGVPNAGNVKQITLDPAGTLERVKAAQQLFSVEQELKEPISKLSYSAGEALVSISRIVDNHDQLPRREKALRHVYYDLCKAISSALSPQLVWQTSENIHWRLRGLHDVEADIANPESLSGRLNFVMYYSRDPEPKGIFKLWQKGAPVKGRELMSSVNLLYSGIAKSEMKEMFIDGLAESQNLFDQYATTKPLIEQMLEQLRGRVEFDEYLESESKMSDDLYRRYRRLSNKLDVLKGCGMPLIKNIDRRWLFNSFSHLIYMGTILAIISDYEDWGKDSIPY